MATSKRTRSAGRATKLRAGRSVTGEQLAVSSEGAAEPVPPFAGAEAARPKRKRSGARSKKTPPAAAALEAEAVKRADTLSDLPAAQMSADYDPTVAMQVPPELMAAAAALEPDDWVKTPAQARVSEEARAELAAALEAAEPPTDVSAKPEVPEVPAVEEGASTLGVDVPADLLDAPLAAPVSSDVTATVAFQVPAELVAEAARATEDRAPAPDDVAAAAQAAESGAEREQEDPYTVPYAQESEAVAEPQAPWETEETSFEGILGTADEEEIANALDLGWGAATEPKPEESSQAAAPAAEPAPVAKKEWYLGIDEVPVGPLTMDRVLELWERGEITQETPAWRPGFSVWRPLWRVPDLASRRVPQKVAASEEVDEQPPPRATHALSLLAQSELEALGTQTPHEDPAEYAAPVNRVRATSVLGVASAAVPVGAGSGAADASLPAHASVVPEEDFLPSSRWSALEPEPRTQPLVPAVPYAYAPSAVYSDPSPPKLLYALFALVGVLLIAVVVALGVLASRVRNQRETVVMRPPAPVQQVVVAPVTPAPASKPVDSAQAALAAVRVPDSQTQEKVAGVVTARVAKPSAVKAKVDEAPAVAAPSPGQVKTSKKTDEDFERAFGGESQPVKRLPAAAAPAPAPGDVIAKSEVMAAVAAQKKAFLSCGTKDPSFKGQVAMSFAVTADGAATNIVPTGDGAFREPALSACVVSQLRTVKFAKHKAQSGALQVPFQF